MKNITEATEADKGMIESLIKGIISDKLAVDEEEVVPDADIHDHLGADSLDNVELIMELEKEFDISIPDEDCEGVRLVKDYYKLVAPHLY